MMKRKIFKTLETIKRKCAFSLILAGFAMINTGFTEQEVEFPAIPIEEAQVEETNAEPTAIAVGENGQIKVSEDDELTRAFADVIENSLGRDLTANVETPFEEPPAPEEVVETPQGYVPYTQVLGMEATAYLPTDGSSEGLTAMGIPATYGIVAVDPDIIPLGTRVYIPGYGEALAADTGGAIYGYRIDLCMEDYWQAMDFGRRTVTVFVLK
ncbi:MAG: 3D domain-containing protein [Selenomonadaceae bacterium]|nr:3D domain-containing protein [Selenomonadaceae bacterium]